MLKLKLMRRVDITTSAYGKYLFSDFAKRKKFVIGEVSIIVVYSIIQGVTFICFTVVGLPSGGKDDFSAGDVTALGVAEVSDNYPLNQLIPDRLRSILCCFLHCIILLL